MTELNPTLVDGLWPWRQHLDDAAMVLSTLAPGETLSAARELARDLARPDRAVVLSGVGAREPLFWLIPAGKELDTVRPDLVLLLVQNCFSASTRLLLATARYVILITGSQPEDMAESGRMMQMIVRMAAPSHVEVVVVADSPNAAQETGGHLVGMASRCFGNNRTTWRLMPAQKIRDVETQEEERRMASTRLQAVPLSEAQIRVKEWEASFRRAEALLQEAHAALRRQLGEPVPSTHGAAYTNEMNEIGQQTPAL